MIASDILVEALSRGLPGDRLVVDPDVLAAISHDDAEWAPTGQAAVGVRARSEAEVQHVVRTCAELDAPIVPRGAGTGLSGGANAVGGCVILDLSPMNQILEIDEDNLLAVVQPGVINTDLKAAVAEHGLWYPPDPASARWSTIAPRTRPGIARAAVRRAPGARPEGDLQPRQGLASRPPLSIPA